MVGEGGVLPPLENQFALYRYVPELSSKPKITLENGLRVERGLESVRGKAGFAQGFAPANPVATVPIALTDARLFEKAGDAKRHPTVLLSGPPYLVKDVLLLHVTPCPPTEKLGAVRSQREGEVTVEAEGEGAPARPRRI